MTQFPDECFGAQLHTFTRGGANFQNSLGVSPTVKNKRKSESPHEEGERVRLTIK